VKYEVTEFNLPGFFVPHPIPVYERMRLINPACIRHSLKWMTSTIFSDRRCCQEHDHFGYIQMM
jgi:hypothetical protein